MINMQVLALDKYVCYMVSQYVAFKFQGISTHKLQNDWILSSFIKLDEEIWNLRNDGSQLLESNIIVSTLKRQLVKLVLVPTTYIPYKLKRQ